MAEQAAVPLLVANTTRGTAVVGNGKVADNAWTRLVGLVGSPPLVEGQGLLIVPCSSIHMFFMGFAIDAIYLDRAHKVVGIDENLRPGRIGHFYRGAQYVLEVPVGTVARSGTRVGDSLAVSGNRL